MKAGLLIDNAKPRKNILRFDIDFRIIELVKIQIQIWILATLFVQR
jgi:hypothetical protein